ncbi:MAG TPA: XRE family transcriptional regulator [Streptosporangiaceae bacterium]|jgi:Zn-dependent peptidase ImmA (M78 family)/transcriptional regulator with XRE-family HTH domain
MDVDLTAVGARVRAARERAGLSQRNVESEAGVSQSTLHRVETGKRTNATLADFDRLAQALGVGLDELLYGSAVEARVLGAARTSGCTDGAVRTALEQGIELLKLDDWLDAVVTCLRQEATHPVLEIPAAGSPQERGHVAAERVREALGLGSAPIADLVETVEHFSGVDVGTMPLPPGVSGICATDPERATSVVLVNSNDVVERQRFTLAHELGHLLFGDKTHVDALDCERSPQEVLCDEFARHLLIPEKGVRMWLNHVAPTGGTSHIDERVMALLARHFGASPEATRIQLDRMGLLFGQLRDAALPSGRRWAYRYGWGPQFDSDQAAAGQPRVPRRILDRAIEAYREGKLGISALAKLQDRPVSQIEQALTDADIFVKPDVRRADVAALVARASAQKSIEDRSTSWTPCRAVFA